MRSGALAKDRSVAAAVLDDHPDIEPWLWERQANAGRYSSYEVCVHNARTSDILILILAENLTPVTETEWRSATDGGANCALLLKRVESRTERARSFIAAQRSDGIDVEYATEDELETKLQAAVRRCMTDAVRRRTLARRRNEMDATPGGTALIEAGIGRAEQLWHEGSLDEAERVVADIEQALLAGGPGPAGLNLIGGLLHGAQGKVDAAIAAYQRIISDPSADAHENALALQNIAIETMLAGHFKDSKRFMKQAFRQHQKNGDWFGVLQVMLNMANLALDSGDLEHADQLAAMSGKLIEAFDEHLPRQRAGVAAVRGSLAAKNGEYGAAVNLYRRAYQLSKQANDADGQVVGAQNVAAAYFDSGRYGLALRWGRIALELANLGPISWRREAIHRLLALVAIEQADLAAAEQHLEDARALAASIGDDWRVATLTADLGAVLLAADDDRAGAVLDEAAGRLEVVGDAEWQARVAMNAARFDLNYGQLDSAIGRLEVVAASSQLSPDMKSTVAQESARLQLHAGRAQGANRSFRKALGHISDKEDRAEMAGHFAVEMSQAGLDRYASNMFKTAIRLATNLSSTGLLFDVYNERALHLDRIGDSAGALTDLQASLSIATARRDNERKLKALHNIGELSRRNGDAATARRILRRAHRLAQRHASEEEIRSLQKVLALAELDCGDLASAEETAQDLQRRSGLASDANGLSVARGILGGIAFARGDFHGAAKLYRSASRLNTDDPVHHIVDLCGVMISHAAANRWRPTGTAVQRAIDYAQERRLESKAWPGMLITARHYLDRGGWRRAAVIAGPAWILAAQSGPDLPSDDADGPDVSDIQLLDALLTSAFHELWCPHPCNQFYDHALGSLGFDEGATMGLRQMIDVAREAAVKLDE